MSGELNETLFCYHSGSATAPGAGQGGSTEGATGGSETQPAGGVLGVDECACISPVCSVCSICATFVRHLLADMDDRHGWTHSTKTTEECVVMC